jgi:biotin-dependent carboxylase-like uncharacterized protein
VRRRALEVLATGPLTLVEDLGRPGFGDIGVTRSGAADRIAFGLGARLVGHSASLAGLEVLLGGLDVRARGNLVVALTGAPCPASVDGVEIPYAAPVHLSDGQQLRLGSATRGLRCYVSVRGGVEGEPVLGSLARDTLSGLGPPPLRVGDVVTIGSVRHTGFAGVDVAPVRPPTSGPLFLRVLPGPRASWLAHGDAVTRMPWRVASDSDRVAVRLDGPPLPWRDNLVGAELPSEGIVRGAIQMPPSGRPVLFLADHPVTGGYPVVAVVRDGDVDLAAQARPGQHVWLREG